MNHAPNCEVAEKLGEDCTCAQPTVWLINESLKWVDEKLVRHLPLETLKNFGTVVRCLPDGNPPAFLDGYVAILREKLAAWRDGDFIACVGDSVLLVAAAVIVGGLVGGKGEVRTLKWSRKYQTYEMVVIILEDPVPIRMTPTDTNSRRPTWP